WILKRVDDLSGGRNIAIHAPFVSIIGDEADVRPHILSRNPLASKMIGKDVYAEFEWYEKTAKAIHRFAMEVTVALMGHISFQRSWPDRPALPTVKKREHD